MSNHNNKNEPYVVYKNDLKYRKHRDLDKKKIIFNDDETERMYDMDLDSVEYRFEECVQSNCITLDLKCMELTDDTFPVIPHNIVQNAKYVFLSENNLTKIPSQISTFKNIDVLDMSYNNIQNISMLPSTLLELCIRDNPLTQINVNQKISNMMLFDCANCKLSNIPNIFVNLKTLMCGNNKLTSINGFVNLKKLICDSNQISNVTNCPNLEYLDCNKNKINELPDNMPKLGHLICSDTNLSTLPYNSPLKSIEVFHTDITKLHYIPTLGEFLCNKDQLKSISSKYKIDSITEHKKKFIYIGFQ